jgi:aminoglycoside phosphotransferase (APT) family kinase protein
MTDSPTVRGIQHDAVSHWLEANVEGAVGPFTFAPITGGHSNLTYRVVGADGLAFVLRRPPLGAVLATAHDMAREHRIISGVGRSAVPVPQALALCEDESVNDAPFYVMNFVGGKVLSAPEDVDEWIPGSEQRASLSESAVNVLATLHQVDPDTVGLGDLGRKENYLDRQLKRWRTQWEKSKTRELAPMEEAYELLVAAKPEQRYTGIVHGDYRLGNMLSLADGSVNSVLDWELCTLGDTLADIGYTLNDWVEPETAAAFERVACPTAAGGFVTRAEFVRLYAEKTGRDVQSVDYYRAFQYWRLAAIVEGVLARYMKGVMSEAAADTEPFQQRVDFLADQALTLIRQYS